MTFEDASVIGIVLALAGVGVLLAARLLGVA